MHDRVWLAIGLIAQLLFFGRFLVQWITSERRGKSTIPPAFWYFSLVGGVLLLAYSIARRDPIFIIGQALGLLVYVRNLMLLDRDQRAGLARVGPWLGLAAFALALGLAFIGTRGLWEPDEGRYAASAHEMLASGDFLTPRLGGEPHFTKPPITYWAIAGSMAVLGPTEIAVRLPTALAFAATVLLVGLFGARLWDRRTGLVAGVVYATFGATFAAANIVTPDTPLTLWEGLALYAFWRGFESRGGWQRRLWPALTGAAFGLAMMTKGPPGLLFLPAMLLFRRLPAGHRPQAAPVLSLTGVLLFCAIGLSWYVYSCLKHPGLLSYFVGEEIFGRIAGQHQRNPQWYGALVIYGPMLLLGTLPWCLTWPGVARRWRESLGGERMLDAIVRRPRALLLAVTILLPLVVLALVRSRLPLYILPLFVPLALITARGILGSVAAEPAARGALELVPARWARVLPAWVAFLIAGRLVFAAWPGHANARTLYRSLPREKNTELVVTDTRPHYGLAFYYGRDGERVEYASVRGNRFSGGDHRGEPIMEEVKEESTPTDHSHLYLVADADWPHLETMLNQAGAIIRQRHRLSGVVAILTERRVAPVTQAP